MTMTQTQVPATTGRFFRITARAEVPERSIGVQAMRVEFDILVRAQSPERALHYAREQAIHYLESSAIWRFAGLTFGSAVPEREELLQAAAAIEEWRQR